MSLILVIEDEPKNMKLIADLLTASSYDVIQAWDGQQGIDMALERLPDLVLTDIQMPEKNGLEVARTLRADSRTQAVPIIALTSNAMAGDREKTIEAGCDDYLSKPINIKILLEMVAEQLEKTKGR